MDGSVNIHINKLLARLAARTTHSGTPKPGYEQNVASIRAQLAALQVNQKGRQ